MEKVGHPIACLDSQVILDRLYEIALDPSVLEEFVDLWDEANLSEHFAGTGGDAKFDELFGAHLDRASQFLQHEPPQQIEFAEYLKPYDSFAAFLVDTSLVVIASNQAALDVFGITIGDRMHQLNLPKETEDALTLLTRNALKQKGNADRFLKVETGAAQETMIFRVMSVAKTQSTKPAALIISTHFQWRASIGRLLHHAFHLTSAEQAIVRLLSEGMNTQSVASARGTSEGTVRSQIKSIISKMNLRSQVDVVRFALTLGMFSSAGREEQSDGVVAPAISRDWQEAEVSKPFSAVTLPDGRTLAYHEMGPSTGNPVLLSHLGSCMVRWPGAMVQTAHKHNLRVICPIRAGYGPSTPLPLNADVFASTCDDTVFLLAHLGITRLPYAVQGTDFPFAADLVARQPNLISSVIGIGGRPCLPCGLQLEGEGRWQRFFVRAARQNPKLLEFASNSVMAMSRRIGAEAMLRRLCRDSPSDLALFDSPEVMQILTANIELMALKSTNAGRAFAMEYLAFHSDWSDRMPKMRHVPVQVFLAQEDPTISIGDVPVLQQAYPWIRFEVLSNAGLALIYQRPETLIPILAEAAKRSAQITKGAALFQLPPTPTLPCKDPSHC